jgi:hypothetical protein
VSTEPVPRDLVRRIRHTINHIRADIAPEVRLESIIILFLVFILCVYAFMGYLQWINDTDPAGILPRRAAADVAAVAEPVVARPNLRPRRVILLLIDGLRADRARSMRSLNALAQVGSILEIDVGVPSMSRPAYVVYSSGSRQDRNGIRTNAYPGAATVDSIWQRARSAGLEVQGVSNLTWWTDLFPESFDRYLVTTQGSFEQGAQLILEGDAQLILLHPTHVDSAGHHRGGVSTAYREAADHIDQLIERLLDGWIDLDQDALLIVSDHGHRNKGGHGGSEPHVRHVRGVAAGAGLADSGAHEIGAFEIAPAIAILLGIPFPRDNSARPPRDLFDAAVLGDNYLEQRYSALDAQLRGYLERLAERGPAEFDPADGFAGWRRGMQEERLEGRNVRLGIAITVLLAVGFFIVRYLKRARQLSFILAGLTFPVIYVLAGALTENAFSLSSAEREYRYLIRLGSIGLLAFMGQLLVMELLRIRDWARTFMIGAWFSGASVALVLSYYGVPLTAPLPSPPLFFWPLFATLMTATQAGMGLFCLGLLWLAERRSRRRWRSLHP